MATTVRIKSWVSGDTLTAADLNTELNNLLTGGINNITDANVASGAAISTSKIAGTAATLSGTETLANKTLGTGTKIALGSDAQGDIHYRDSSGNLVRLAPGTSGQFLQTQGASANPQWANSKSFFGGSLSTTLQNNTTTYSSPMGNGSGNSSETQVGVRMFVPAGIVLGLYVRVESNSINGITTVNFRKNGVNAGPTFTINSSTNGNFSDTTQTTTVLGDLIDVQFVCAGGSGNLLVTSIGIIFAPS